MAMKTAQHHTARFASLAASVRALASASIILAATPAVTHAALLYWDADGDTTDALGGNGNWRGDTNAQGQLWRTDSETGALATWTNGSTAVFSGTASSVNLHWSLNTQVAGIIVSAPGTSGLNEASGKISFLAGAEINVYSGSTFNIGGKIDGANGYTKTGSGALNLFSATADTFTGTVTHDGGTLQLRVANAIGASGSLIVKSGSTLQFISDTAIQFGTTNAIAVTIEDNANALSFRVGRINNGAGVTHTFGSLKLGARTVNLNAFSTTSGVSGAIFADTELTGDATLNISTSTLASLGAISETGGSHTLTKTGVGELILRGMTNTATGNLILQEGTTTIDIDGGENATFAGGLDLGSASKTTTLTLNAHNVTFAESLNIVADATIDFSVDGASSLAFTAGATDTWTGTLFIANYNATEDSLRIGTTTTALSSDQLASIVWIGLGEGGAHLTGAYIDANGYVTATAPVPEPATWTLLSATCAGVLILLRRKR